MNDQSRIPGPPNIGKLMTVPIEEIVVAPSRLDEKKVAELMESILAVGVLQPILVVAVKGEDGAEHMRLVAGRHRLEAAKRLGLAAINCTVLEYDGHLLVQLAEIDENLIRNTSAAKHALLTGRRRQIITELAAQDGTLSQSATASSQALRRTGQKPGSVRDQANKTGESKDKIHRSNTRFKTLGSSILESIIGTSLDTGAELDALMKLSEAIRDDLVNRVAADPKVKVSAKRELRKEKLAANEESRHERPVSEIEQAFREFTRWKMAYAELLRSNNLYEHADKFHDIFCDVVWPDDKEDAPERENENSKKNWFNWGKDSKSN